MVATARGSEAPQEKKKRLFSSMTNTNEDEGTWVSNQRREHNGQLNNPNNIARTSPLRRAHHSRVPGPLSKVRPSSQSLPVDGGTRTQDLLRHGVDFLLGLPRRRLWLPFQGAPLWTGYRDIDLLITR